jgi:MSHA biogenesis protein MshP
MRARIRSAGMALISAIFLIVVLIGLGLSMMTLSNVEHDTGSKAVLSAKVYYGARAGLDWGIQQAIAAGAACTPPVTGTSTNFNLTQGSLNGVAVTVTCAAAPQGPSTCGLAGTSTCQTYYLTSVATTGTLGALSYAERRIEATVSNIP